MVAATTGTGRLTPRLPAGEEETMEHKSTQPDVWELQKLLEQQYREDLEIQEGRSVRDLARETAERTRRRKQRKPAA